MQETLKKLREEHNYSQATIAEYLNISRQMYIKYETGTVEPSVTIIKQLCSLYKVAYEIILDNKLSEQKTTNKAYSYNNTQNFNLPVCSPSPSYTKSVAESVGVLNAMYSLLPRLSKSEELKLLSRLVRQMEQGNSQEKYNKLSDSEVISAFNNFNGCIDKAEIDEKRELYSYLDERYGEKS